MSARFRGRIGWWVMLGLLLGMIPFVPARAQTVYQVEVGRPIKLPVAAESIRFFPSAITVHPGDVLHLTSQELHSVALLPAGAEPDVWVEENWAGQDATFSPVQDDPDDGSLKINRMVAVAEDVFCGRLNFDPCSFTGEGDPVVSGLPLTGALDYSVVVEAEAGTTLWAVDLLNPSMRMRIDVVGDDEAVSDPAELDAQGDQLFAQDTAAARDLHQQYVDKRKKTVKKKKTTWQAWAGLSTDTVALRAFYPSSLTIRVGHRVRWSFAQNAHDLHTVTFPHATGLTVAEGFPEPACDPDGDPPPLGTGPSEPPPDDVVVAPRPDEPPSSLVPPYCAEADQLELDVPFDMASSRSDGAHRGGDDFDTSGIRGPALGDATPFKLRFAAKSPKGSPFRYVSMMSTQADGTIVVKKAKR